MATFDEVLKQIFHSREVKVPLEVPGEWESLETDFTQSDWGPTWSHSVDEGFSDCIIGVEFDDEYLMNIVISRANSNWHIRKIRKQFQLPGSDPSRGHLTNN